MAESPSLVSLERVVATLRRYRFRPANELGLQEAISKALTDAGIEHHREVILSPAERIDFVVMESIGIECKVDGSLASLTRQVHGYTRHERIGAVLVVTTRSTHRAVACEMNGKPVRCLWVSQ